MADNFHRARHYLLHFLTAKRRGHGVHSPFAYRLCEDVFYNPFPHYDFGLLNQLRKSLLRDHTTITVEDHGAGSRTFRTTTRQVARIAANGITGRREAEILYRLVNFLGCKRIVELGTSLGLTTLYLARGAPAATVYSIEGAAALSAFASALAGQAEVSNIRFVADVFDKALPAVLSEAGSPDLVYIDGNHTYEATLRYYEMIKDSRSASTVIVLDDLYWSPGMTKAWHKIVADPDNTLTIDGFHLGFVFFRTEFAQKQHLRVML
jgi:predicted O-methyltransferase YrrM